VAGRLGEKLLYLCSELLLQLTVEFSTGRGGKPGMDTLHAAIPSHEDSRGPGIQVDQLWHLLPKVGRRTCDEIGVLDSILLHKGTLPLQTSLLLRFLKVESDNCQTPVMIFLVQLDQILRLIVAIRARWPGPPFP
jgi:hypothetical protein